MSIKFHCMNHMPSTIPNVVHDFGLLVRDCCGLFTINIKVQNLKNAYKCWQNRFHTTYVAFDI